MPNYFCTGAHLSSAHHRAVVGLRRFRDISNEPEYRFQFAIEHAYVAFVIEKLGHFYEARFQYLVSRPDNDIALTNDIALQVSDIASQLIGQAHAVDQRQIHQRQIDR